VSSRFVPLGASLINPFVAYAAGFLLAFAVYSLGYSDLYPPLQPSLEWFLLSTCAVCIFLGYATRQRTHHRVFDPEPIRTHVAIFVALVGTFMVEVVANGGIPLLLIAGGADFSYRDFGVPVLHVAFSGFCYFFAVYWFDLYLLGRGRLFLLFSGSASATSILIFSRGAFIVTLIAIIGVYIQRRGIRRRLLVIFAALAAALLWGFGFLGDIRTHGASGESIILSVGDASDKFRNSNIPTELFWPYLYTSSPLANLQLNITDRVANDSPGLYFALEFLPDFVSKRLVSEADIDQSLPLLVTEQLTVCTMYGRAFVLMGWLGVWLSFGYLVAVSLVCLKVLEKSKYLVATTGILSSLAFLSIFDNLYIVSGGIMQVLVALVLKSFERTPEIEPGPQQNWKRITT
jgi:oligosaccharide repeat unit polymerase